MSVRNRLSSIKTGALSRGMALAKLSVSAGAKAAGHALGGIFADEKDQEQRLKSLLMSQATLLTRELGELKGSLMKVGQMVSVYGEKLLPPEANAMLKSLQSQSPALEWRAIEKALVEQLGKEKLSLLEIEPEPFAAASLGQVHLAWRKTDGKRLALKIQYPGVDQAIDNDLKALRRMMSIAKLIPKGPNTDEVFAEIKEMLIQEVDYRQELQLTREFKERLREDSRFVVPEVLPDLSTHRVLATSFEEGLPIDHPDVFSLSQERRNTLGFTVLELYFRELFVWSAVQTDPHFGNYRVRIGKSGERDQLVLLDFGAVKKLERGFTDPYFELVRGAFSRNKSQFENGAIHLGFLRAGDPDEFKAKFAELCFLILEPFDSGGQPYSWRDSDLHKRVLRAAAGIALALKLRTPPREIIFLDRKMAGMFIMMSTLGVKAQVRELLAQYLNRTSAV
jgi:predicted unusual protein kinase regulating ubiquinone biosynthesis (AarF/ABC1/UbiB family)